MGNAPFFRGSSFGGNIHVPAAATRPIDFEGKDCPKISAQIVAIKQAECTHYASDHSMADFGVKLFPKGRYTHRFCHLR